MSSQYLSIRKLSKRFGSFVALRSIDLDIGKGEFVCFLGPSGCGKTTLLRAIAGLDRQDAGTIHLAGRDVSDAPPSERDFGIVFQSYALFPNLTVGANVGYGLVNRRLAKPAIAARVAELLTLVGLADQGAKYPVQLSGGQQQRVALARALATSPGLLLLDEPLSALDAKVRVRLREEIRSVQRKLGVTTIMVTHDQEEALSMADRVVVMNHGVIEQVGTPEDVYRRPTSLFVADFVGAMTFLPAVVKSPSLLSVAGIDMPVSQATDIAAGTRVQIGIRPEDVVLHPVGTQANFVARVETVEFLGATRRARLRPEGSTGFALTADLPVAATVGASERVSVSMPPAAIRIFTEGAAP